MNDVTPENEGVTYVGWGNSRGIKWQNTCKPEEDDLFQFKPVISEPKKNNDLTHIEKKSTYKNSYWVVQLTKNSNFILGSNDTSIPMFKTLTRPKNLIVEYYIFFMNIFN